MLVMSRKRNESIVIDGTIVLTVVDIRGDKVRLGIEAPKHVPIHRSEVYDAIQKMMQSRPPSDEPEGQAALGVSDEELHNPHQVNP